MHPYLKILYDTDMLWIYDVKVCPKRGKVEGDVSPPFTDFRNNTRACRRTTATCGRRRDSEMFLGLRDIDGV